MRCIDDPALSTEQSSSWFTSNATGSVDYILTTGDPHDPYAESPALFYFRRIVPGILLLIAVPGNFLSMAVMCRKFFRSTSAGVYLFVLLVADTVYLFSNYSFIFWLINNFKTFALVHDGVSCKLWVYLMETSGYVSSWVLVALAVERAIVIRAPHRRNVVCQRKRAGIIVAVITIVMMMLNSYVLVTFDSVRNKNDNTIRPRFGCYFGTPYSSYGWLLIIYNLTPFLMYAFLPACCIVVCNVVMVCTLARRPKLAMARSSSNVAREAEARKVTMLLMGACVFFLVSTVPVTTLTFLEQILNKLLQMDLAMLNDVYLYIMVLLPLNQTFNFTVYCIAGSSFRKELKEMLGCCYKQLTCPTKAQRPPSVRGKSWAKISHQSFDKGSSHPNLSSLASASSTDNTYL